MKHHTPSHVVLLSIVWSMLISSVLLLTACGIMQPQQPTAEQSSAPPATVPVATATPAPLPTTTPVTLSETFTVTDGGFRVNYPHGWATTHTANSIAIAANDAAITADTPGADMVMLLDYTAHTSDTTYNDVQAVFDISSQGPQDAGYALSNTVALSIATYTALQADLSATGGAGRLVVLVTPKTIIRVLGQAAPDAWQSQQTIFDSIVQSLTFFTPEPLPTPTPQLMVQQPAITTQGPAGFLLRIGGHTGEPDERFVLARGIAVAVDGTLYVAESNHGIWLFAPDGKLLKTIGSDVVRSGAYDVALSNEGDVFVADYGHNAIVRFAPDGTLVQRWGESGQEAHQFGTQAPQRIAVSSDDSVFALDSHMDVMTSNTIYSIIQFNGNTGTFLRRITLPQNVIPNDIAVDTQGILYVADATHGTVIQFDQQGNERARFGTTMTENGTSIAAAFIDVDRQGNVYVATWDNGIVKFAPDGSLIARGGAMAASGTVPLPGQFSMPNGIAVAPGNAVWVSDNSGEYSAITALRLFTTSEMITMTDSMLATGPISQSGMLHQWAYSATASSAYGDEYSPNNATGAPNVDGCSDSTNAWAPATPNSIETLELSYEIPVFAAQVRVFQSHQPGFITSVELLDERNNATTVYRAEPVLDNVCPAILAVSFEPVLFRVVGVRVTIDQRSDAIWSEIDAVELIGTP